ncbi:MAG: MOP flippase family protein [Melioribacteraceae bacterium]|jgi:O-antigen/teichoic acid export membrane protein|nr:MOP flippase family protein [Melioribacteraceae bacterium]
MSVSNQVVTSVKWASFSKIIRIVLQYITLLVLVVYLSPSDFGLMSTAMIFIGFFNSVKDFGFSAALIQLEDKSEELLSSVFWLNVFIGIFFSAILFYSSTLIAVFYEIPELEFILEVLSINFVFNTIMALQNALFEKNMNFDILSKIEIFSISIGAMVAILFAILEYGVWALVFQTLTVSFLLMILNWIFSDFRPKFYFSISEVKKVFNFGIHLSGFNILNFFVRNADYFLIGKFLGMTELGFYTLAYRIMLFPIKNITSILSKVLYPALSKIGNDNSKSRKLYLNVGKSIAFVSFPLMIGFFVVNENMIKLFFSEKWTSIIDLLYLLVPIGMIQSVYTLAGAIYQSKNRTKLWFQWGIFSALITVLGFYFGLKWGVLGVAGSYLITNLLLVYPGSKIPFDLIGLKVFDYWKNLFPTFSISISMGIIVYLVKILTSGVFSEMFILFFMILVGIVVYIILSYQFNKDTMLKIMQRLKTS